MKNILIPLLSFSTLALLSACGKEETTEAQAKPAAPKQAEVATVTPIAPAQAQTVESPYEKPYQALGYFLAANMQLQPVLDDGEIDALAKGLCMALSGEPTPENFRANLNAAMAMYEQKLNTYQSQQMLAKQQQAASKQPQIDAFFADLENKGTAKTASGLYYKIADAGDASVTANTGDRILMHYKGSLIDGRTFDSSYDRGEPLTFPIDRLVPGVSEGLKLIGKGGKITLYIPSELGYGMDPNPQGIIEPGDPLVFEIELLDIFPGSSEGAQ